MLLQRAVFKYKWWYLKIVPVVNEEKVENAFIKIGKKIWIKPSITHCMRKWGKRVATDIQSRNNVTVNVMLRHVLDIRCVVCSSDRNAENDEQEIS